MVRGFALQAVLATVMAATAAGNSQAFDDRVLEIRTYVLKPGTRAAFHRRFEQESLPLLRKWHIDVVAHGPSLHDQDTYFLIRSFDSLAERDRVEEAFYTSAEWRLGPREAVMAAIDSYTTLLLNGHPDTIGGLRRIMTSHSHPALDDHAVLLKLNDDYVNAVQASDARRFEALLASDFLCTLSDGRLLDRAAFLQHVARPPGLRDLRAHDVQIRILGDVAIVHARTTFQLESGAAGSGRYTDVWARRNGTWQAVAAHVTREQPRP